MPADRSFIPAHLGHHGLRSTLPGVLQVRAMLHRDGSCHSWAM